MVVVGIQSFDTSLMQAMQDLIIGATFAFAHGDEAETLATKCSWNEVAIAL